MDNRIYILHAKGNNSKAFYYRKNEPKFWNDHNNTWKDIQKGSLKRAYYILG